MSKSSIDLLAPDLPAIYLRNTLLNYYFDDSLSFKGWHQKWQQ